jgi:hypothetical protein
MIGKDTSIERSASFVHELCGRWPSFNWQQPFKNYPTRSCGKTRLCAKAHGAPT